MALQLSSNEPHGKKLCFVQTLQNTSKHEEGFKSFYYRSYLWKTESVSRLVESNSATPWTVARQAPLSMEFSRQEHWSEYHALLQQIFPTQGSNPGFPNFRQILFSVVIGDKCVCSSCIFQDNRIWGKDFILQYMGFYLVCSINTSTDSTYVFWPTFKPFEHSCLHLRRKLVLQRVEHWPYLRLCRMYFLRALKLATTCQPPVRFPLVQIHSEAESKLHWAA